jgi:hypothetical protein
MTQVEVGQVWADKDKRRGGRLFMISNIDDGMATCENLPSKDGKVPGKPISFIRLDRFKTVRHYSLIDKPARTESIEVSEVTPETYSVVSDEDLEVINNIVRVNPTVVKRNTDHSQLLLEKVNKEWPTPEGWKKIGSFFMTGNDMFEISVRPEGVTDNFEVRIKLYNYCVFDSRIRGTIEDALVKCKNYLRSVVRNVNDLGT